ncbi:hypothetical protein [Bacillus mycoides]|nr:hypothetical protein [Bacillus mycoides]
MSKDHPKASATKEHTVTAVQFENDNTKDKVLNFVESKYEVKEKK